MTKEDFDLRIKEIEENAKKQKWETHKQYAESNNPYKIGDIIEDHYHVIVIESMRIYYSIFVDYPEMIYKGKRLTYKLKPYKTGESSEMQQSGVIKKHEGEIQC